MRSEEIEIRTGGHETVRDITRECGRFLDEAGGSWWHELSPSLSPSTTTWDGKPDVYHAVQATLLPRLSVSTSLATALQRLAHRRTTEGRS